MSDFSAFSKSFTGELVVPGDAAYAASIARWASNAQRNAKVVAFVNSPEDVALTLAYAKASKLPVAIRGGGHSAAGASSAEGGVVIDLSRHLNEVDVDAEGKLARVGGGALWRDVDKAAIEHGLAAVAGTVNHTGVGGLTLGGGFGWLSGAHGLVIDNLLEATLVTADGSIKTLSSSENEDLFWGIRGGGCNFGVVTQFVFQLHAQRRTVYAGPLIFAPTALEDVMRLTTAWWENVPDEKEGMCHMLTRCPDGKPVLVVLVIYNGSEQEGRAAFKPFLDLGPMADMSKEIPYEELNALHNGQLPHGRCTYMKGVRWTKPRVEIMSQVLDEFTQLSAQKPDLDMVCMFEYFGLKKACGVPDGATAAVRSPYCNVLNVLRWDEHSEANTVFAREASRKITDIAISGNVELKDKSSGGYGNYDPELALGESETGPVSDRAEVLFGANYPRLQALKKKYDPEVVFSKWFVITPA
ncbi:FAD-binding domain-containing protein [Athelia psychrophila]|uniref:FAD-binding domain-containing protein n=1 Tax=Athelia psychrophila TaxID=1759441 RepID=A0A166HA96_9AGAM|nr:FAD-binding domain-containing protein [Fibularhizoctonia sp. CBS 109695]